MNVFTTGIVLVVGLLCLVWFSRRKRPVPLESLEENASADTEPEYTDDELALLLGRQELKRARAKLIARAGLGRSRGHLRAVPFDEGDDEAVEH